ncbi:hypothetical protein E24_00007 [Faustovirus]|nr:hypothetical protein PRJ_Fausto_00007 [Faustovirus]AMN82943.1 hypothetical protein E24_00007 [Faustovirus]AMN83930.1 hypothetical protein D5a_00007 [Faustovirus]AMN84915.1 hypothetical protein E23_00007 [Faustovirus]QBR98901.1 hypothetical protein [Faustovirus mariensis]
MLGVFPIEIYVVITRYHWGIYKSMFLVCRKLNKMLTSGEIDRRIYTATVDVNNTLHSYTTWYERLLRNMQKRKYGDYYKFMEIDDRRVIIYKPHLTKVYTYTTVNNYYQISCIMIIRITEEEHVVMRKSECIYFDRNYNTVKYISDVTKYGKNTKGELMYRNVLGCNYEQIDIRKKDNKWAMNSYIDHISKKYGGMGVDWESTLSMQSMSPLRRYLGA